MQYIRWGVPTCPDTNGTELLYLGAAAGTSYSEQGGGSNYLCLPDEPEFLDIVPGLQLEFRSGITGVEYQAPVGALLGDVNDRNVPCAACYTAERAVKIMIPGRVNCMPSWTREYYGYLMAERDQNFRNSFECVDVNAEVLPNSAPDRNGALFYHAEARQCQGTQCLPTPYSEGNELTCVVCTK